MDITTNEGRLGILEYIEREVKIRSKRLIKSYLFYESDYDEIAQDLRIKAWKSLDFFDEKRAGLRTYLNRVLDNRSLRLIANQKVRHRKRKRLSSIDELKLGGAKASEFFVPL